MLPVLQVGPLVLPTASLLTVLGLGAALWQAERQANRQGLAGGVVYDMGMIGLLAGVAGARLVYVVRFPEAFLNKPLEIVSLNAGLFAAWGGVAAGVLAALGYGWRKGLPLWSTLDALTPSLAMMALVIALAHAASGEAFGAPANVPWAIELWGERRHPTQIYEALAAAVILWTIWPRRAAGSEWPAGVRFLMFVALTAAGRLFLEAFRGDSWLLPLGLRGDQVVAWLVLAASLWQLGKRLRPAPGQPENKP